MGICARGILVLPLMASFADNLKRLRAEAGVTQVELARRADLTQSAISRYETGEDVPELASLLKLATGLEIPLEPLVEGLDVKFDAVYGRLRITVTDEGEATDVGAEAATDTGDLPITDLVPGAPPDGAVHEPADVAKARAQLERISAELLAVTASLIPRSIPVARDLGPGVREGRAQRRSRARQKHAKKASPKRR